MFNLKTRRPDLTIALNGGIVSLDDCQDHLEKVDGVMIGRAAYQTPWLLAGVDEALFDDRPQVLTRREALERYLPYVEAQISKGVRLHHMARHMLGLFQGEPGARHWRRYLSENMHRDGAHAGVLEDAALAMERVAA